MCDTLKKRRKMKKLIIAIAMIGCSVVASAASFKWTAANIYDSSGSSKFTGTAAIYAYTTDAASAVKVVDAYVVSGVIKSDAEGTATGYTANWSDAVVGTTYTFYMIIEDDGKALDTSALTSPILKTGVASETGATPVAFGNMTTATQSASNWAAVPEPTSGLLMLLGVAGLALKRKRA